MRVAVPLTLALALLAGPALAVPAPPDAATAVLSDALRGCTTDTFGYVPQAMENTMNGDACAFDFHLDTPVSAVVLACDGGGHCHAEVQGPWYVFAINCAGPGVWTAVSGPGGTSSHQGTPSCAASGGISPVDLEDWFAFVRVTPAGSTTATLTVCTSTMPAAVCPT